MREVMGDRFEDLIRHDSSFLLPSITHALIFKLCLGLCLLDAHMKSVRDAIPICIAAEKVKPFIAIIPTDSQSCGRTNENTSQNLFAITSWSVSFVNW